MISFKPVLLSLIAVLFLGCKANQENANDGGNGNPQKPSNAEQAQKNSAFASGVLFEVKSMVPVAMTDETVTLRVSYSFNQEAVRSRQVTVSIKKGEAADRNVSEWLGSSNRARLEMLVFRSRAKYEAGDMFGFAFITEKGAEGVSSTESQAMVKAFISEAGSRPTVQILKSKFEFPAKSELRVWLNE